MHTVAGGGSCSGALVSGGLCDGVSALTVPIAGPRSVAALPGGGFLYVDAADDLVREVAPAGSVTTVAGNGTTSDAPDGTLAVDSGLDDPVSVAALPDGGFLITEYAGSVVRMVSPGSPATATITTIAGESLGPVANNVLSGSATSIPLDYPTDAVPTPDGGVLIADTYDNYIRLVSAAAPGQTMTTIAGGGACHDVTTDCDGLSASAVALDHPDSVSPLQDGSGGYLISEYDGSSIREVSQPSFSGTFTTVAGIPGDPGYSGDGGPATAAQLSDPEQVVSTAGGGFLIADTDNNVIRQVSASGTITTIAGNGIATYAGDATAGVSGPATAASLFDPAGVSPTTDGGILIADQDNDRIREITIPPVATITLSPSAPNGSGGWYVTPVTATVSTTEGATINCELDPVAPPPVFEAILPGCSFTGAGASITGNGGHSFYAAAENVLGDDGDVVDATMKIDVGPPPITCGASPSFPFATAGAKLTATLADAVSGPASEMLSVPVHTSTLGPQTVQVAGENNAGTAAVKSCPYTVTPLTLQPLPTTLWRFSPGHRFTTVDRLVVDHVPAKAAVNVTCVGGGCPFSVSRNVAPRACTSKACRRAPRKLRTVSLTHLFAKRQLVPGTVLDVSVTERGAIGRVVLFRIRAGRRPKVGTACLVPGSSVKREAC